MRLRLALPLAAALVVGGILLVDALVVTDEEAIEALLERAADAARRGDEEAFRAVLADDYRGEGGDASGAVRRAERARQTHGAETLRVTLLDLSVDGDRARGPVKVGGVWGEHSGAVSLDVHFVRTAEGWKVAQAWLTGVAERLGWGR